MKIELEGESQFQYLGIDDDGKHELTKPKKYFILWTKASLMTRNINANEDKLAEDSIPTKYNVGCR